MKKAQILSQPIIFIFILIVSALVLAFGIRAVLNLQERAELIQLTTSVEDLKDYVETYYSFVEGSSTEITLNFPSKIKYICIVAKSNKVPENIKNYDPYIEDYISASPDYNLFMIPQEYKISRFKIPNLKPAQDPLCFSNPFKAIIENKGTHVEILK